MAQPGASDYLSRQPSATLQEHASGMADQIGDKAQRVGDSAAGMAGELATVVKDRPYATLALVVGLAFAVGAVWKLKKHQAHSRFDRFLAQLPELPSMHSLQSQRSRRWW